MREVFRNKLLLRMGLINLLFGAAMALIGLRTIFLDAIGFSESEIGVVLAACNVISMVAPLIGNTLADRFRARYTIYFVTTAGFCACVLLLPLLGGTRIGGVAVALPVMLLLNMFYPVSSGLMWTATMNAVARPESKDCDYSLIRSFYTVGYMAANFAFTPIMTSLGFRSPYIIGIGFFAGIFFMQGGVRETVSDGVTAAGKREKPDFRGLFGNYYIVTYLIANIFLVTADNSMGFLLPYLLEEKQLSNALMTTVTGFKVIIEFSMMMFIPYIRKKLSISGMLLIAGALPVLEMLLLPLCHTLPAMLAVEIANGCASGIVVSNCFIYISAMAPKGLEATAVGLYNMTFSLGGMMTSLLFGVFMEANGVVATYRLGAGLQGAGFMIFLLSLLVGKYLLKKKNAVPLFLAKRI